MDETFRFAENENGQKIPFGALCGVGIPIASYSRIANAIFRLKDKENDVGLGFPQTLARAGQTSNVTQNIAHDARHGQE